MEEGSSPVSAITERRELRAGFKMFVSNASPRYKIRYKRPNH